MTDIEKLKELEATATKGPWETDDTESDGEYGIGDDTHSGFRASTIEAPDGHGGYVVLFDSLNSTASLIEEEYDEDGHVAWDEVARKNAALIVAMRNALPALLASLASKDAEIERLKAERGKALAAVAFIADEGTYSDSYGVPGSDFGVCRFCEAGGGPGVPFEHSKNCPILRCEQVAEQWWEDRQIDIEDAAELRAEAAESRLTTALAALGEIGKRAYTRGDRTFDQAISDLMWIDDECRATLAKLNALERK